jgi:two-component sensor histidine kinase
MQMSSAPDRPAAAVLPEAINRILAIAAVHETLSESGLRLTSIKTVLTQVADTVIQNLSRPDKDLRVTVSGDDVELPSQAATALALATNELVQNALEHAFVGRDAGLVAVVLSGDEETLTVSVTDDGIGLDADSGDASSSLGLEIVRTLVTEDLKGSFSLTPDASGTRAIIRLPQPGLL